LHWAKFGIGTTDVMAEPGVKVLRYSPVTKRIYWIVEFSNLSGLFSCDPTKCTTTVVEMMPRAPRLLGRIALDSTHVYFTDKRAVSGGVYRCPLAGCDASLTTGVATPGLDQSTTVTLTGYGDLATTDPYVPCKRPFAC
jgi:hypothetical protein